MDKLRPESVAACVVAWHNRHPLARRITPAQVQSIGYVALPFAEPDGDAAIRPQQPMRDDRAGPTLRQRVLIRVQHGQGDPPWDSPDKSGSAPDPTWGAGAPRPHRLRRAFKENFIAPVWPRRVARWALRFGQRDAGVPKDGPVRVVDFDDKLLGPASHAVTIYVVTAAVESGDRRTRVLVGPAGQVLGPRLWSGLRTCSLSACMAVTAAAALTWPSWPAPADWPGLRRQAPAWAEGSVTAPAEAAVAGDASATASDGASPVADLGSSAAAVAAVVAVAAPPADPPIAPLDAPEQAVAEPLPAAPTPTPTPTPVSEASPAPPAAEPRRGDVHLPPLRPWLDDASKAQARDAVAALRRVRGDMPVASLPATGKAQAWVEAPAFALSSRPLRTRAESEQMLFALRALLAAAHSAPAHIELMAAGEDWRVVCWPFAKRADAERARALLVSRGLKVDAIDF